MKAVKVLIELRRLRHLLILRARRGMDVQTGLAREQVWQLDRLIAEEEARTAEERRQAGWIKP